MVNDIEINSDRFAQVRNARNTETAEDYTEMIADLIRETGEARAVDLAKHFGVTGPTVNSIIRRLVREGLVESRPYRSIFLTEKGKLLADYCKKRHEIVYKFLIKIGVNEEVAKTKLWKPDFLSLTPLWIKPKISSSVKSKLS